MIKLKKGCTVCAVIKTNSKIKNEIFGTRYYLKTKGRSLADVANEYKHLFSYQALKNHCKKHQFIDEDDYTRRHAKLIEQDSNKQILKKAMQSAEIFNEIMEIGLDGIKEGNIRLKASDVISAAKYKKEFELKEKDQELQMLNMVMHFASGENEKGLRQPYDRAIIEGQTVTDYDPTAITPDDSARREAQSRAFYQSLTGDAAAPGTD